MTVDTPHGRNCNCHLCAAPAPAARRSTDRPDAARTYPWTRALVAATFNQENER